jgi:hypothetical protein
LSQRSAIRLRSPAVMTPLTRSSSTTVASPRVRKRHDYRASVNHFVPHRRPAP